MLNSAAVFSHRQLSIAPLNFILPNIDRPRTVYSLTESPVTCDILYSHPLRLKTTWVHSSFPLLPSRRAANPADIVGTRFLDELERRELHEVELGGWVLARAAACQLGLSHGERDSGKACISLMGARR